jgi:hypothetical protein
MKTAMSRLAQVAALVAVCAVPGVSNAILMFDYSGTCTFGCGTLGLDDGDAVGGFIATGDTGADDLVIAAAEITDYLMAFGTLEFAFGTSSVVGALSIDPGTFELIPGLGAEGLRFSSTDGAAGTTGAISISLGFLGDIELEGWLTESPGRFFVRLSGGPGSYTYTQVPEPSMLTLFGVGLLALGVTARSRRRRAG